MRRATALALPLVLAVAACGDRAPDPADRPQPRVLKPTAKPADTSVLPDAFVGRWGLVAADCDPKETAAKGLMTVAPDRLTFWESRAKVTHVGGFDSNHVVASLAWTGEGQSWTSETPLTLVDEGGGLVRRDHETGKDLRYLRCPASGGA